MGVPLLGVVPESPALRQGTGLADHAGELPRHEAEIFGLLRADIRYFNVDRDLRTVVIVSAAPGDGKTTVARGPGHGDGNGRIASLVYRSRLRRPVAARCFGIPAWTGSFGGAASAEDTLAARRPDESSSRSARGCTIGLDVLVAGDVLPPEPAAGHREPCHGSAAWMHESPTTTSSSIDTPPLVLLPDAFPLLEPGRRRPDR